MPIPPIEFHGATWLQVCKWAADRIDALRKQNDTDLDPVKTAYLRGQIKAMKALIALPEEAAREKELGRHQPT